MLKLLTLTLLLLPTAAFANSIPYTFSTMSGITGTFTFDDSTEFYYATGLFRTNHYPESQFPTPWVGAASDPSPISGTYGDYSFSGLANIWRLEYFPPYDSALDFAQRNYWILHSDVSSPEVSGKSLTFLGLYDYVPIWLPMTPLLDPPPNPRCDGLGCTDFSYIAQFSDGTQEEGGLMTLATATVPEPSSLMLLSIGAFGVILYRRGTSSRRNLRQPER